MRELRSEVLVLGAGPAGIAAAVSAERAGARALLVDMQAEPGGQIWRGQWNKATDSTARRWLSALRASPVEGRYGLRLVDVPAPGEFVFDGADGPLRVHCERAVIAAGARERLLPFPGWTLPGVFGAGGLQVLAKNGWPVAGKRIVVAGSGPLLLAAAASLRSLGAQIVLIAEQSGWRDLAAFGSGLLGTPHKVVQAAGLWRKLIGVPYRTGSWVTQALGDNEVRSVIVRRGRQIVQLDCDALAVGYGLVPNTEIARALGCELRDGAVWVDMHQHTSVPGVYCAGEGTGIGGIDQALVQGEIAGCAAAGRAELAATAQRRRRGSERFAAHLRRHFGLRAELRSLAQDDTVLCRCENVAFGAAKACSSMRDARLQTRLGMGHCQARVCGAACEFLFGWGAATPRPPLAPAGLSCFNLSTSAENPQEPT
ncbi:thioredoxin reductase [Tahibacter aquaticus]|uniref:Thioredoxin reductase n=1 Tax=Tahibacter aquaticus TaxID=520092 RepID=A0A4R6Z9B8_9GAMM|nr:FAD/NAD(P)-binding oxidoreductase [Tahibacter aquaticus]TDR48490.1 thioredoxin reductase [Tahibacter aquaticus]